MKKIVISLAGLMGAVAFSQEASAVPSYARQVGMSCNACHAQHFPVLNSFGRAFKASGYTLMGAQGKIEDEHLSIPDTLNASMLAKVRYQKNNNLSGQTAATPLGANTQGDGQVQFGEEFALFFGGRISDNIGMFFEGNVVGGNSQGGMLATVRFPFAFDVGGAKLSVVPFTTDANGVQIGYELSSGGVQRTNRWMAERRATSAIQYLAEAGADGGAATGFAFVAQNEMGFINYTKWSPNFLMGGNQAAQASYDMDSNYFRIAATPTIGDWAILGGIGIMSGTSVTGGALGADPGALIDTKQNFLDIQAQGQVGGKELSLYAQYAKAPLSANPGAYNANSTATLIPAGGIAAADRKAWSIGADYSVIPHVLSLGAAYRHANTGAAVSNANILLGRGTTNNAVTLLAVYDYRQNVAIHLNHAMYSGSDTKGGTRTTRMTLLELEMAF